MMLVQSARWRSRAAGLMLSALDGGGIGGHIGDCCILGHSKHVSRAWIKSIVSGEKQIHRIGNNFYWGAASTLSKSFMR